MEEDNIDLLPENTPKPTERVESSHANWRRYIYRVLVIAYSESCDTHAMNLWGERQIRVATNSKLLSQELVDTMSEHDIADTAVSHINYVYGRESLQMERTGDVPSGILTLSATSLMVADISVIALDTISILVCCSCKLTLDRSAILLL